MRMKRLVSILTLLLFSVAPIYAQNALNSGTPASQDSATSTQDDDDLKSQQQIIAELKMLRAQHAGLIAERDALKGQITLLEKIAAVERERGDFYKTGAERGLSASSSGIQIDMIRAQEVRECTAENARLRIDNEKLRSSRNTRAIITGLIGVGAGYAIGNR